MQALDQDLCDLREEFVGVVKPLMEENKILKNDIAILQQQQTEMKSILVDDALNSLSEIMSMIAESKAHLAEEISQNAANTNATILNSQAVLQNKIRVLEDRVKSNEEAYRNSVHTIANDLNTINSNVQSTPDKIMKEISMTNKLIKDQGAIFRESMHELLLNIDNKHGSAHILPPQPPPKKVVNLHSVGLREWVKKPTSVYIGRANVMDSFRLPRSKWQNVYTREDYGEKCLRKYESSIRADEELIADLIELRGKELGCTCKPNTCHGDVLIRLLEYFHGP